MKVLQVKRNPGRPAVPTTALVLGVALASLSTAAPPPPATEQVMVVDRYHGREVIDEYQWLEDHSDQAVKQWNKSQNEYARGILDTVSFRSAIKEYLTELMAGASTDYYSLIYRNGKLFALKFQPPKEQPLFITLASADDLFSEHVVLDVTELNPDATTSIDFYEPSPDGSLVAVSLSEKGSEKGTVHIFEVATGKKLPDVVPRVNGPTAGGDVAWNADGTGFFYTRYPHPGERSDEDLAFYQQIYFHVLGTDAGEDTYVLGREFPKIAEIELETSRDGKLLLATVANGDGGEYAHYLRRENGQWTQLTRFQDQIPRARFGPDNSIYFLNRLNTPNGKVIRLEAGKVYVSKSKTVAPEDSVMAVQQFLPTEQALVVVYLDGGPSRMKVIDLETREQTSVTLPPISSFSNLVALDNNEVLFRMSSYTDPPAWYHLTTDSNFVRRTALERTSPADFSDIEVVREFATSKDGTRVPINILYRTGTEKNGANPTVLYGYGGYGISMTPGFSSTLRLWFDQGGIYAVANLRGGGEYGEKWHRAGNLTNKQNVFDDFAACAQYLMEEKYTSPSSLVIKGGSNGGLLMGAAVTQHPELYAAAVSSAGIYDMLRVELDPNGEFNTTEFGTVNNPEHFEALLAYSPFHNVKVGTEYPAVLFLSGEHDGRVNPAQSRKMTARLQAATASDKPILLRTSSTMGHGRGTALSERIDRETDTYAFILSQLGMTFKHDR